MVETFFTEKRIIKKIIIVLVFIFLFNFTFNYLGNNVVLADEIEETKLNKSEEGELDDGGGKLLIPIQALVLFIADAALEVLQNSFVTTEPITLKASTEELANAGGIGVIIGGIIITALVVVAYVTPLPGDGAAGTAIAASYWAWAIGIAESTTAITIGVALTVAGPVMIGAGGVMLYKNLKGEFDLPNINLTPSAIFSNSIPILDANFFNPSTDKYSSKTSVNHIKVLDRLERSSAKLVKEYSFDGVNMLDIYIYSEQARKKAKDEYGYNKDNELDSTMFLDDSTVQATFNGVNSELYTENIECVWEYEKEVYILITQTKTYVYGETTSYDGGICYVFKISAFDELEMVLEDKTEEVTTVIKTYKSTAGVLQTTVSSMYKTLRTVAIVALLSILVYVGIRMVLSSASKDKAKYKQMIIDWLVALIMLFVLHYIMAFVMDICVTLTDLCSENNVDVHYLELPKNTAVYDSSTKDYIDIGQEYWPTNFVGMMRFNAGLIRYEGFAISAVAATLMYVVLVIYIIIFMFQYMRRVLYLAFLTMIAPLVAITYPIDKINDGKAQGFSMWLKEYIFNALLQPIHYIIYVIIMGSVNSVVQEHPVYAIVALGFMVPAEKFIRKMFGFEKASTVGGFGAAAGAAALMSGLQKLRHKPHKKDNDNGAKGKEDDKTGKIRTISSMPEGPGRGNGGILPEGPGGGNGGILPEGPGGGNGGIIPNGPGGGNGGIPPIGVGERNDGIGENNNTPIPGDPNFIGDVTPPGQVTPDFVETTQQGEGDIGFVETGMPTAPENQGIRPLPQGVQDITVPGGFSYESTGAYRDAEILRDRNASRQERRAARRRLMRHNLRQSARPIKQGVRAVGGHYTRRLENRLRKAHPLRALRRGITFGAGALTFGTLGVAAGITSGDPNKVFQYATAASMAGGHLGQNLGETASNIVGLEGAANSFRVGSLGNQNDDIERARYKRNFKRNVSNYDAGVKNVGADGWSQMSKDGGIIDTGLDYGINNIDDLSNIYRAQQKFLEMTDADGRRLSDEEAQDLAFKAYKLDSQFGDYSSNSKTQENLDKLLISKGWTDDAERELIKQGMLNTMRTYQKVSLDEGIEEPSFDYRRMSNTNNTVQGNENTGGIGTETEEGNGSRRLPLNLQLFAENNEEGVSSGNSTEGRKKDDDDDPPPPPIPPNTATPKEDRDAIARAANAQSEAARAETRRRKEIEENKEQMEEHRKALKEAEKTKKKEERREEQEETKRRSAAAKKKREELKEDNGVEDGEQGSAVRDFDRRKTGARRTKDGRSIRGISVRAANQMSEPPTSPNSPISSDPLKNGNGPINNNPMI